MEIPITVFQGDITSLEVDAIVNAANSSLMGGGGVDGAIHRKGGPAIAAACRNIRDRQGGCPTGEAVITEAGLLPAKYVIHTVGPIWKGGHSGEHDQLAACYRNSLALASQYSIKTIAFPNISTGVYGFPKKDAAHIAVKEVKKSLELYRSIGSVIFCCFDAENFLFYESLLKS